MTTLSYLLNPPPTNLNDHDYHYQFLNSVYDSLVSLQPLPAPSIVSNPTFSSLGSNGQTPITEADGDTEISSAWHLNGSANGTYEINSPNYAANSPIITSSPYFINIAFSSYNGNGFYIYQRQIDSVRKYQNSDLSYGFLIKNNQSTPILVSADILSYYDTDFSLKKGGSFSLSPGLNSYYTTIKTESLRDKTVGASPYTEFRFNFLSLNNGTCDIDIYQIKCEFGTVTTPIPQ